MVNTDPGFPPMIMDVSTQIKILESLAELKTLVQQSITNHHDHESRIRKLERAIWIATGAAAAGGGVVGAIATHLSGG